MCRGNPSGRGQESRQKPTRGEAALDDDGPPRGEIRYLVFGPEGNRRCAPESPPREPAGNARRTGPSDTTIAPRPQRIRRMITSSLAASVLLRRSATSLAETAGALLPQPPRMNVTTSAIC